MNALSMLCGPDSCTSTGSVVLPSALPERTQLQAGLAEEGGDGDRPALSSASAWPRCRGTQQFLVFAQEVGASLS